MKSILQIFCPTCFYYEHETRKTPAVDQKDEFAPPSIDQVKHSLQPYLIRLIKAHETIRYYNEHVFAQPTLSQHLQDALGHYQEGINILMVLNRVKVEDNSSPLQRQYRKVQTVYNIWQEEGIRALSSAYQERQKAIEDVQTLQNILLKKLETTVLLLETDAIRCAEIEMIQQQRKERLSAPSLIWGYVETLKEWI